MSAAWIRLSFVDTSVQEGVLDQAAGPLKVSLSAAGLIGRCAAAITLTVSALRQFTETKLVPPADDTIASAQQWMLANISEMVTVAQMAARAHMSERSFHRHFTERTGTSPLSWLRDQRISRARELLEGTRVPIENIADQVGFAPQPTCAPTSAEPPACPRKNTDAGSASPPPWPPTACASLPIDWALPSRGTVAGRSAA